MRHLEDRRTQTHARYGTATAAPTRYGEVINRYLSAAGYREPAAGAPPRMPLPAGVVLVGVDETPTSYTAVDHAAVEAELRGWGLRMMHVQHSYELSEASRGAAARLLEHMTDRVHAYTPDVAVTGRVAIGAAAPLLLSDAHDANLVVVGHRHRATGTAFGLSVAERVAAHHTGPALVVRVPDWPPGPGFGARPLVVGVDARTPPEVVRFAREEARVRGCELIVLHAGTGAVPGIQLPGPGGVVVHERLVPGDPVAALLAMSDRAAAVVVGRRGPGGFAGALLGPVSRAMVQRAQCPVFLVG
ncbi:universal stress protein [Couchioplanes caeruleus]|uniref:universal stress protein n=1 Tax=Couchioplanes caeruleus TaxID=56438 RepID=UPI0020BF4855|nr:universal stress protein [Couchioplanes caeruleus]UQU61838.1 universal stress protein [Couchioplanes caeruleus]